MNVTLSKKIVLKVLKKIKVGTITLRDSDRTHVFENSGPGECVTITIKNPQVYKKILSEGSVGAGRGYIDGDWDTDDLTKLISLFIKNVSLFNEIESPLARLFSFVRTIGYKLNINTVNRAKDNILAHYDLGNDFFKLILDPSMMYSCALYEHPDMKLDDASLKKIQKICSQEPEPASVPAP